MSGRQRPLVRSPARDGLEFLNWKKVCVRSVGSRRVS